MPRARSLPTFLWPRIIPAIVDGAAPADLTITSLAKALPYSQPKRGPISMVATRHLEGGTCMPGIETNDASHGAQNPCMVPRSQQRPMFNSTNQNPSVAIFIGKPIPRPEKFFEQGQAPGTQAG